MTSPNSLLRVALKDRLARQPYNKLGPFVSIGEAYHCLFDFFGISEHLKYPKLLSIQPNLAYQCYFCKAGTPNANLLSLFCVCCIDTFESLDPEKQWRLTQNWTQAQTLLLATETGISYDQYYKSPSQRFSEEEKLPEVDGDIEASVLQHFTRVV